MSSQPNALPESSPSGQEFKPFVPAEQSPLELTIRALVIGSVLGIVFAASSVYLGLKVGLTVSASIPVAVLSITIFRWATKAFGLAPASILENNIVQTTGSAGESIAAGVAFTLPSLLLMGFDMELSRILIVAMLGGLIGVLMMIPLRQGLIVKEHGKLMYPEGTACADVLIVGEKGGSSAKTVFQGFFVGLFYAIFNIIAKLWSDTSSFALSFWGALKGSTLAFEVSPPMLGVGYIIGFRTAANMMAGGVLAFMILVPLIHLFGDSMPTVMYPGNKLIRDMNPYQIRNAYILYIGAGAVATGGIIALIRSIPTIANAFMGGLRNLKQAGASAVKRTEKDLPMQIVLGGAIVLALLIWLAPLKIGLVSAILILMFGFFFTTVSSRITGEIGSSSNPISGMTVATLLITCTLFRLMDWTGPGYMAIALTTAAFVCVAASNGGTISQDLKTGFLVGGTPWRQQSAILVGVLTSALVIGVTMKVLDEAHTTYEPAPLGTAPVELAEDAPAFKGPDGKDYRVHYQRVDVEGGLQRGRYLVDDAKTVAFNVVASVDPAYPWKLGDAPAAVKGKTVPLLEKKDFGDATIDAPPADAPVREGLDGEKYKVVTLAEAKGDVPAGEYLVSDKGVVAYSTKPSTEYGLDRKQYTVVQTERDEAGVPAGRYLLDAAEGGTGIAYVATENWKFDAPKAQLFRLIIDGMLGGKLPAGLVLAGALLAIMMELVGVSSLPFAVGLYLPISTSAGIFVGGIVRKIVDWKTGTKDAEAEFSPGVLMASGLIAGGAIAGVIQSIIAFNEMEDAVNLSGMLGSLSHNESWWPLIPFLAMAGALYYIGTKKPAEAGPRH